MPFRDSDGVVARVGRDRAARGEHEDDARARVEDAGDWKRSGARSAAEHLARLGGTTVVEARRALDTSKQVAELPAVLGALQSGALSRTQADAIAGAASADPGSEQRLLEVDAAHQRQRAREECLKTRAAADPDPEATYRRIDAHRRVGTHTDAEGGWNLGARGTADKGAKFEAFLKPKVDAMFAQRTRKAGASPREAYVFDALMALADGDTPVDKPTKTKLGFLALLHVPIEALTRGWLEGEETCELPGYGPIPVPRRTRSLG